MEVPSTLVDPALRRGGECRFFLRVSGFVRSIGGGVEAGSRQNEFIGNESNDIEAQCTGLHARPKTESEENLRSWHPVPTRLESHVL